MDVLMKHQKQPEPVGCMYFALHAFVKTAPPEWLADTDEVRFLAHLIRQDVLPFTMHEGRWEDRAMSLEGWEKIRSYAQYKKWPRLGLLVTIASPRILGNHMVAVHLQNRRDGEAVHVSDPAYGELQVMTWAEFLASAYRCALAVTLLQNMPRLSPERAS